MKKATENLAVELVPLSDIVRVLGTSLEHVRALADRKGAKVTEHWDGELCVDSDVAQQIRLDREAEEQAELKLRMEHDAWLKARASRKSALVRKVRSEVLGSGSVTPTSSAQVFQATQEAMREFDERDPELDFYRWRDSRSAMVGER